MFFFTRGGHKISARGGRDFLGKLIQELETNLNKKDQKSRKKKKNSRKRNKTQEKGIKLKKKEQNSRKRNKTPHPAFDIIALFVIN